MQNTMGGGGMAPGEKKEKWARKREKIAWKTGKEALKMHLFFFFFLKIFAGENNLYEVEGNDRNAQYILLYKQLIVSNFW